jgi:NAD(P)-dependent dehydrogenase (short-subunit alcohol dehydrogenase family)
VKTIVITGVTRGLGRAMADKFISLGHTVLGCGRSRDAINQLTHRHEPPHDFAVVDVSSDAQVASWASRLLTTRPPPDLLINNAAIVNRNAPLWQISASDFSRVIDVNIKGVVNVIRHFVPPMIQQKRGVIVNFSSGWGRSVDTDVAPYCATKWAIEGLTRALALELPEGMAAIPLNPGVINTDMLQSCFGNAASSYPNPQEWANRAVPFLLRLRPADSGKPLSV